MRLSLIKKKKCPYKSQTPRKKTGRMSAGVRSPLTFSLHGGLSECERLPRRQWASTPISPLQTHTHTHTHGPPLPPINSTITPPSGGPVLGDTHTHTHTHTYTQTNTHTHSRRGVGPAPLFLCALVTKEFWLPLPLFLIIGRSLTLSHSL